MLIDIVYVTLFEMYVLSVQFDKGMSHILEIRLQRGVDGSVGSASERERERFKIAHLA